MSPAAGRLPRRRARCGCGCDLLITAWAARAPCRYHFMAVEDQNQCFCGRAHKPATGVHAAGPAWCAAGAASTCPCNPKGGLPQMCCCAGNHSQTCGAVGFLELFDVSSVHCHASPAAAAPDLWRLATVAANTQPPVSSDQTQVKVVHIKTGQCAASVACNWTTQTRNCHDNSCHDSSSCPVVLASCDSDGALWLWNASTGTLRHRRGDVHKPTLPLCLDAGTTYPNTACGFGINTDKPFCDPALPTEQRARDLVRARSFHLGIGPY